MNQTGPLLSVRDLSIVFPPRRGQPAVRAVDGVSFDIAFGQTLALVGESGSGKTTTGRAILQLQRAESGTVTLLGRNLNELPRREVRRMRRHMQFVLQNPYSSLNPRMTVAQILTEPLRTHGSVPREAYGERVVELLEMVGLDPGARHRYPHAFSGGQRQRIVIARALAVNPDFVVCDEPVSALDVRTQAQIVDLLQSLQARLGLSYLFIAHDLAIVQQMAHRVAVMYAGHIVELGDTSRIYSDPRHPYTRTLLESVPVPDARLQRERLRRPAPATHFQHEFDPGRPCAFGEIHAQTRRPTWHEIGEGHRVSCRFWNGDKKATNGKS